ncbi:phage tail assembly chaperone G [Enterococcus sp. AZ015]|uniref:phage tail assembly chaperone G n=1 Tax=unclassified Enterococcus TaxID=2608891 RepID=UPI003D2B49D1
MIEINLLINGEQRTYTKSRFTLKESIYAMQHQIIRDNHYSDQEKFNDPEAFESVQQHLAETISKIFGNQFSPEQLMDGLEIKDKIMIDKTLVLALGGELKKEEKSDEEEAEDDGEKKQSA